MTITAPSFCLELATALGCEPVEVRLDAQLENLPNFDSMGRLAVISMVDERFGSTLDAEDLNRCATVEALYLLVRNRLEKES